MVNVETYVWSRFAAGVRCKAESSISKELACTDLSHGSLQLIFLPVGSRGTVGVVRTSVLAQKAGFGLKGGETATKLRRH